MTRSVDGLTWLQSPLANKPFAQILCDPAIDSEWSITLSGTDFGGFRADPIAAIVINQNSADGVSVFADQFPTIVPPYQTITVSVFQARQLRIVLSGQPVTVLIVTDPALAQTITNQYGIAFNQGLAVVYTTVIKASASESQAATDGNKQVRFVPPGLVQDYNLLSISGGPVPDGFMSFVRHGGASGRLEINPSGADTINNLWTAAAPLRLSPGDQGILFQSAGSWDFRGVLSHESDEQALDTLAHVITHDVGKPPDVIVPYLRCKTAELGFSVGNEVMMSLTQHNSFGGDNRPMQMNPLINSVANSYTWRLWNLGIAINRNDIAQEPFITNANWRFVLRAKWFV